MIQRSMSYLQRRHGGAPIRSNAGGGIASLRQVEGTSGSTPKHFVQIGAGTTLALFPSVRAILLPAASILLMFASSAHADALRIETLEDHTWPQSVASLQKDRESEGRTLHVIVKDVDGSRLHCGTYAVSLDEAGADAFTIEGCDDTTNSTAIRLVHRSALFEHGDVVPRPRAPRVTASRTQTGASAGGARSGAESAVDCQVTVHPFMRDLENGGRVDLAPGRYTLRTKQDDVQVKPVNDGWMFIAARGAHTTVEYFITDTRRDEVVLNDRVTMNCSVQTSAGSGELPESHPVVAELAPQRDKESEGSSSGPWQGNALTVNLGLGSAVMRSSSLLFANSAGIATPATLGIHDSAGPMVHTALAYERTGIYSSLSANVGATEMSHRTLWYFSVSSVIAAALHFSDTTLYLGPDIDLGMYQISSDTSQALAYASKPHISAGAATGVRFHVRDDKTGKLAYVLGAEIVAPIAGASPWFLTAQIAFGSAK
jgi:hypothetical protein